MGFKERMAEFRKESERQAALPKFTVRINGEPHKFSDENNMADFNIIACFADYYSGFPSITFKNGPPEQPEGHLTPMTSVRMVEGMEFTVKLEDAGAVRRRN